MNKKIKKVLFLITLCLLLTGCTVNYDLKISESKFEEKITGSVLNEEIEIYENATSISTYLDLLTREHTVFKNNDSIFYNKKLNNTKNATNYEYTYTFNDSNFINSNILNNCFEYYTFKNENDSYYISLSGKFTCLYTEQIKINVTTDYKVVAHNAKRKKKNTYTWTIDKTNDENVSLFISIDKNKNNNTKNILNWSTLQTIGLIILLPLSAIAIFIAKKKLDN